MFGNLFGGCGCGCGKERERDCCGASSCDVLWIIILLVLLCGFGGSGGLGGLFSGGCCIDLCTLIILFIVFGGSLFGDKGGCCERKDHCCEKERCCDRRC